MLTLAPRRKHQLHDRSLTQQAAGLVQALLEEFRKVPDEWKEETIQQIQMFRRLADHPPARLVGEDKPSEDDQDPRA